MTTRQLKSLVKWARSNGLTYLKLDGVEFALKEHDPSLKPTAPTEETIIPSTQDPSALMPSDTDMLLWSTGAFDEIHESRKE